ncbi:hypothetical protein JF729_07115 [Mycobacterium intracellulare]|uniref:hypothetical protein n=1 Tax=Mycobacterium intracellulare TaxID=1767 RepID=UPI001CD9B649|nr:hypothetical protein [Mycobacterium intracellulare]MCA2247566.1 hypothetical protein [Mycobacterium intracellulare]
MSFYPSTDTEINIRPLGRGTWHVECPETGDSAITTKFADALTWGASDLCIGDSVTFHMTGIDHEFLPVAAHPDDDECTHRSDGTDATYCGQPRDLHS